MVDIHLAIDFWISNSGSGRLEVRWRIRALSQELSVRLDRMSGMIKLGSVLLGLDIGHAMLLEVLRSE